MLKGDFVSYSMIKQGRPKTEDSPPKVNGYQDERHPVIIAMDNYLKQSDSIQVKTLCNYLKNYYSVGNEYSDNVWYQRILKLRTGEYKQASPEEIAAIQRLLHVEHNKHLYGAIIHNLGQIERKTAQIEKYLQSGFYNKTEARKRIKELKTLNRLSVSFISENDQ